MILRWNHLGLRYIQQMDKAINLVEKIIHFFITTINLVYRHQENTQTPPQSQSVQAGSTPRRV